MMSGRVHSTMASRSMLLRRNRRFRRLWLARVVSALGDAVGLVAFILYVAEEMDSATAVALLLVAGDFIPTLLSPFIGVVADRLERRRLLIICELGQALAIGAFVIAEPPLGVLLCWWRSAVCSRPCSRLPRGALFPTWWPMRTSNTPTR